MWKVSNSIKHKSSHPYLMEDKAWLSWEWSVQHQETGRSQFTSLMLSSWIMTTQTRSRQLCWNGWSKMVEIPNIRTLLYSYFENV